VVSRSFKNISHC